MAETDWRRVAALVALQARASCGCTLWDAALSDKETLALNKAMVEFKLVHRDYTSWLKERDD